MPDSLAMQSIYDGFRYGPIGGGGTATPTVSTGASGLAPAGGMNLNQLTEYINQLNRASTSAAEAARIPMGTELEQQSSRNIGSELSGTIDPDVMRLLQQQSAERGAAMGMDPNAQNVNAAYLRALGLTSTGLKQQGQADLTAAFGRHKPAPTFDPTTQLVTPVEQQRLDIARQELAQRQGYGGGGGTRTASTPSGVVGYPSSGPTTQPITGSSILGAPEFNTNDWWASIGWNPQTGSENAYDLYEGMFDPANYEPGGALAAGPTTASTAASFGDEQLYGGL